MTTKTTKRSRKMNLPNPPDPTLRVAIAALHGRRGFFQPTASSSSTTRSQAHHVRRPAPIPARTASPCSNQAAEKVTGAHCRHTRAGRRLRMSSIIHIRHSRAGGNPCGVSSGLGMPACGDLGKSRCSPLPPAPRGEMSRSERGGSVTLGQTFRHLRSRSSRPSLPELAPTKAGDVAEQPDPTIASASQEIPPPARAHCALIA